LADLAEIEQSAGFSPICLFPQKTCLARQESCLLSAVVN
jgi:hypothetical protein